MAGHAFAGILENPRKSPLFERSFWDFPCPLALKVMLVSDDEKKEREKEGRGRRRKKGRGRKGGET